MAGFTQVLPFPMRPWQTAALMAWSSQGRRGIVAAATGTGKTALAFAAIHELDDPSLRVGIVVPTTALLQQWRSGLRRDLGLPADRIGRVGSSSHNLVYSRHYVALAVLNSARDGLPFVAQHWHHEGHRVFLIVDECHRAGSEQNAHVFRGPYEYTLGLSATPERLDSGFEQHMIPGLGKVVYRYPLRQALDDGLLASLRVVNLYVRLSSHDQHEYKGLTLKMDALDAAIGRRDPIYKGLSGDARLRRLAVLSMSLREAKQLHGLYGKRRRLLANAGIRHKVVSDIATSRILDGRRCLFFHETIEGAERTHALLSSAGHSAVIEHSKLPTEERSSAFRRFRSGAASILIVVRTADEGIDVPEADLGILVSGTLTARQRIQRIGRLLRLEKGKTAMALSVLAEGTEEEHRVGALDDVLFGPSRVVHHRYESMEEMLDSTASLDSTVSTYMPLRG